MSDDRNLSGRGNAPEDPATRTRGENVIAIGIAVAIGVVIFGVLTLARMSPPDDPAAAVAERQAPIESTRRAPTEARETTGQAPETSSERTGR